jgi:hypothetical protein
MKAFWRLNRSGRPHPARPMAGFLLASLACVALLALAACGVTSSTQSGAQSGSHPQVLTGHTAVRPCTGPFAAASAQAPKLILTLQTPNLAGTAQVGDVVQVRLPVTNHWTLASVPNGLRLTGLPAQQDAQLNVCFWTFKVSATGTYQLSFTGVTPCDPSTSGCQQTSTTERFTLAVH